jgi:hypothetical protein
MKVSFEPTQLAVAVQAPVLRRIIEELTPQGMLGEVALRQKFRDDPMVLVLQASSRAPVRVSFDREMLYSPAREGELRDTVAELFQRFVKGRS